MPSSDPESKVQSSREQLLSLHLVSTVPCGWQVEPSRLASPGLPAVPLLPDVPADPPLPPRPAVPEVPPVPPRPEAPTVPPTPARPEVPAVAAVPPDPDPPALPSVPPWPEAVPPLPARDPPAPLEEPPAPPLEPPAPVPCVFPAPALPSLPASEPSLAVNSEPQAASTLAEVIQATVRLKPKDMPDDSAVRVFHALTGKSRTVAKACVRDATPSLRKIRWTCASRGR